jgi:glycosyltransferase involved in cell wall biosynthesis
VASGVRASIAVLLSYLDAHHPAFELLLVDDGSTDDTARVLRTVDDPRVRVLALPRNRGKFAALRAGMAETRGRACLFTDADVPFEADVISVILDLVLHNGFHVVTGDRTLAGSLYSETLPVLRRVATRAFATSVRLVLTSELFDTQCGIKGFRGDVARELFSLLREDGFAGDVELLYIALKYNLSIRRVPVRIRHHGHSSVRPVRDGVSMLRGVGQLYFRYASGAYRSSALARMATDHSPP